MDITFRVDQPLSIPGKCSLYLTTRLHLHMILQHSDDIYILAFFTNLLKRAKRGNDYSIFLFLRYHGGIFSRRFLYTYIFTTVPRQHQGFDCQD